MTAVKSADTNNTYTYDANGNVLTADNANAKTTFKYDALNRVVAYTTNGQTTKYDYDDRGFMTKLTYPSGKVVTYDYDVMGNMLAVTDWNGHKTTYAYDKNNRVVSVDNWNKTRETRSYDVSGQVTSIVVKLGDKVIQNETYAYDANHNLIKQNNVNHTFDTLNRLTSGYAYDKAGNITSGNGLTMTYDKDSRLQTVNKVATTSDADGNLTAYTVAGKAHKATYNSQNQLTAYDGTTYTYDANGNRLTAGAQTYITDATGQVLADKDNQYVYGAQGLIGYYDKTSKFVTVTSDNRGDILNLLDEAGTVRGTMSYSDYGAVTKTTGTVDTPFRYAGRLGVITDSNGLVYLKTRYYNPQLMRFMNRDTVAGSVTDSQSLNRFSYVEGNPLTYVDLNGQARTWLNHYGEQLFIYTELGLAGLGMIPVLSDATNIIMMGMDLAVGDYSGVALDAVGLVPYANDVSNSAKIARLSAKLDKTASTAEKVNVAEKTIKYPTDSYGVAVRDEKFLNEHGDIDWAAYAPHNGTVAGSEKVITTPKGTVLDRYFVHGRENGSFFGNGRDSFESRSLPYPEDAIEYQRYEVMHDIPDVEHSIASPAFEQVGGAEQFFVKDRKVDDLIASKHIRRIK